MPRVLFYPCCDRDVVESLNSWSHIVDEFWFAEIKLRVERSEKVDGKRIRTERWRTPSQRPRGFELIEESENVLADGVTLCLTRRYANPTSKKEVSLNFIGGCAVSAFSLLPFDKIAVFISRGDNRCTGEGSSGICWLSDEGIPEFPKGFLPEIIERMEPGGFIVSDGSNADEKLAAYWQNRNDFPANAHHTLEPIELHGRTLKCVGSLKPKYGPVLVWQVVG
jgi:hypothetical protein